VKKLMSERVDLPLSGYSSRGGPGRPRPVGRTWPNAPPNGCLTFANLQAGPKLHIPHPRTCISSPKRAGGRRRCGDWIPHKAPTFSVGGCFQSSAKKSLQSCISTRLTTRRVGLQHDAMRTDDLHCGSGSASTQFSIHSLPPLWPKAPHGPNSKATEQCPNA
jgi:hypothetical protein